MTLKEVRKRVNEIASKVNDNEVAHFMEDTLHREVLLAIANGALNTRELAREALKTTKLPFNRWYA